MQNAGVRPSRYGLREHGFRNVNVAYWNLGTAALLEHSVQRHEGLFASGGSYVVRTGQFTGRPPRDKFIVRDGATEYSVNWGPANQEMSEFHFDVLHARMTAFWQGQDAFVQDCYAGADARYTVPIRIVTQHAWHNLFARQLFIRPDPLKTEEHVPEFTVIFAPGFHAHPDEDGTKAETAIAISFRRKMAIIAGTSYAGEIKRAVFTVLNYLLPERGVLPMHCAANQGAGGSVALLFGLSGTGKTTLSAAPGRRLIGDDEHGWSDDGVFNFEGGCYAKAIHLSREREPLIWHAVRFGTILENVVIDTATRLLDFNSDEYTENTRAAYRLAFIDNAVIPSVAGHPSCIVFLTTDAFGVLPLISRLTAEQAMYYFLSGYTARAGGAGSALGREPQARFSACFAEPFLPRHPEIYARMLDSRLRQHRCETWMVNTGWAGGGYGVGHRIDLPLTRAIIAAAVEGKLRDVPAHPHPVFNVLVPEGVPGVPHELLDPRAQWSDQDAYDRAAINLARRFHENFKRFEGVAPRVENAAPRAA